MEINYQNDYGLRISQCKLQENAEQSVTEAPIYESRAHMEGHPMEVTVSTVESNISIDDRKKGHRRSLAGYMPVVNYDYIPGKRIGPESLTYPTHEANDGLTCLQRRKYFYGPCSVWLAQLPSICPIGRALTFKCELRIQ